MADYIEIKDLVNDIMLTLDEDNYDKGQKYHQLELMALQGLKELSFDVSNEIKTTQLTVDSSLNILAFPSDAVKIIKVGVMGLDGEIHPLALENRLSLDNSFEATSDEGAVLESDNNPYYQNYAGFGQYGIGGGGNVHGYYRIDRNSQQIQFSSGLSGKKVVLEYVSNGLSNGIAAGINRVVEITCPAQAGNYSGSSVVSLLAVINNTELTWRMEFTNDAVLNSGVEDFIDYDDGLSATQTAVRLAESINKRSPYHSATVLNSIVTVTYNQFQNWIGVEDFTTLVSDFSVNVISEGSVQSGVLIRTCPQFAEEALRAYIYWKSISRKRGVPLGEKQIARKDFYNQKRLARARSQSFTKDEALYTSRKGFKQSPKF